MFAQPEKLSVIRKREERSCADLSEVTEVEEVTLPPNKEQSATTTTTTTSHPLALFLQHSDLSLVLLYTVILLLIVRLLALVLVLSKYLWTLYDDQSDNLNENDA